LAKNVDTKVAEFRNPALDAGPRAYVVGCPVPKGAKGGRVVSVATFITTGVNAEATGRCSSPTWSPPRTEPAERPYSGAWWPGDSAASPWSSPMSTRDSRTPSLRCSPGAVWRRCRTHAMRNLSNQVPKTAQAMVGTLVRTVFAQSDPDQVTAQFARLVDQLQDRFQPLSCHVRPGPCWPNNTPSGVAGLDPATSCVREPDRSKGDGRRTRSRQPVIVTAASTPLAWT
jgi:putative transposase